MTTEPTTNEATDQSCESMGGLAPQHDLLKKFEGTFRAAVKFWMGPGEPMEMTGTMENSLDLDGRFLKQVYTGDVVEGWPGVFEGRGYWGFNTATNTFEGFWIDNACTFMMHDEGDVDDSGNHWIMRGENVNPQTGGTITKKSTITRTDDDHHSMEMFHSHDGGNEFVKIMEINYTRA